MKGIINSRAQAGLLEAAVKTVGLGDGTPLCFADLTYLKAGCFEHGAKFVGSVAVTDVAGVNSPSLIVGNGLENVIGIQKEAVRNMGLAARRRGGGLSTCPVRPRHHHECAPTRRGKTADRIPPTTGDLTVGRA